MKVLDLQCAHDHRFEGWFDSEDDFQSQLARGLLTCPMCGSGQVAKKLSAPRLNLVGARSEEQGEAQAHAVAQHVAAMTPEQMQAAWLKVTRQVLSQTEDVGERFADEARRIHHGEALLDEGIAVMPLVLPESLKGPVQ